MIRWMGAALLVAGCGGLGLCGVGRLDGRVRDLRELSAGLEALRRELGWRLAPLPRALETAAGTGQGRAACFFRFCAQRAGHLDGVSFQQLWREGLERCPLWIDREDRALLEQLGPVLGRYDGDSQREAVGHILDALARQGEQAAENRRRLGRVYGVLGVAGGLLLAVVLI